MVETKKKTYVFTSESVSCGHPDALADFISDTLVDNFVAQDPNSRCAIEVMVAPQNVFICGEINSKANVNIDSVTRDAIRKIGYVEENCGFDYKNVKITNCLHQQSPDISQGVDREDGITGSGDQGIPSGFACNETECYMPLPIALAHLIIKVLTDIRKEGKIMTYLKSDAKSQVTVRYAEDGTPLNVDSIVVSTSHSVFETEGEMFNIIRNDVRNIVIPKVIEKCSDKVKKLFNDNIKYYINETGIFSVYGPMGDSGLTGRKLEVNSFGGRCPIGGGSYTSKDASKVDRSAAYMARYIAKNMVAAGVADEMFVQLSYSIGVAEPVSIYVNTNGKSHIKETDGEIAEKIGEIFDLTPGGIIKKLKLTSPVFAETTSLGHFGRRNKKVKKIFTLPNGATKEIEVELFTWEKLDSVDLLKKEFGIN